MKRQGRCFAAITPRFSVSRCVTLLHCTALILALCCTALSQQDIYVNGRGPALTVGTSLVWGSSGKSGVNNNFIFTPIQPQQNVCLYIVNNNPSNAHSFSLAVYQSGDPAVRAYSTNSGRFVRTSAYSQLTVSAASTVSNFVHIDAASTVSINVSGSSSAGGNPDTADIYAIQTTSEHCPSSQAAIEAFLPSVDLAQLASYNTQAFAGSVCTVNPALGADLLSIQLSTLSNYAAGFLKYLRISSTVAGQVNVIRTTTAGTTCTNQSPVLGNLSILQTSTALVSTGCTGGLAAGGTIASLEVNANTTGPPVMLDFSNVIFSPFITASGFGVEVTTPAALTGTVCVDYLVSWQ